MYCALFYEYGPDAVERRKPHRDAHLALVRKLHGEGRIVLAGAFQPVTGALLVFRVDAPSEVEEFVRADPYVQRARHQLVDPRVERGGRRVTQPSPAARAGAAHVTHSSA